MKIKYLIFLVIVGVIFGCQSTQIDLCELYNQYELKYGDETVEFVEGESVVIYHPNIAIAKFRADPIYRENIIKYREGPYGSYHDLPDCLRPYVGWVIRIYTYYGDIHQCEDTGMYYRIFKKDGIYTGFEGGEYYLDEDGFVIQPHPLWKRVLDNNGKHTMEYYLTHR